MPRKHKLSGAQERKRRFEREREEARAKAEALGLLIATPTDAPAEGALMAGRRALGEPPTESRELAGAVVKHLAGLAREAELDETLPPERSREQAGRLWGLVGKHIAAARDRDELAELEDAHEELKHQPQRVVSPGFVTMREDAQ